jgi:hypothetical protein
MDQTGCVERCLGSGDGDEVRKGIKGQPVVVKRSN